ncbi:magnesium and cobalt transport protein CorA [Lachnospiraceae bacterium KM106-2]|nr:magnesium and cobalt transport protein CorA [Lachnospiraceae bacterium KM106-2]
MINIFSSDNNQLVEKNDISDGCWISLISPTNEEVQSISSKLKIDLATLKAALDEEEAARLEVEEDYTLILVDIPSETVKDGNISYSTIPLGIILCDNVLITICTEENKVLNAFRYQTVRNVNTKKRMRFVYQMLYRTAMIYQSNLRTIDKRRKQIEERVKTDTKNDDLIELHELESAMVYFATSLQANHVVIDRLSRYKRIEQYPEDQELLEDVIVEIHQAIEMTAIYRDIINGTRELLSTVINNKMNDVMKVLTSITLVMAIPTIISGIYGMNVSSTGMPLSTTPHGFGIICGVMWILCLITLYFLRRKKLL